jgi:hypothetical protein
MTRTAQQHHQAIVAQVRGLYDISRLAYLLDELCNAHYGAQIEAALEGDDSAVPAMLAKAMQDIGAALIAMTAEEVAEALASAGPGGRSAGSPLMRGNVLAWLDRARVGARR